MAPDQHREAIRHALKGKPKSAEHRRKIALAKKGTKHTEETKAAISRGMRRHWSSQQPLKTEEP